MSLVNTFGDFLTLLNNLSVPVGNLGVTRQSMPQIDDDKEAQFLKALSDRYIEVSEEKVPVTSLSLTQAEINKNKVWAMMRMLQKKKGLKPTFVSSDGFVLDGSHRMVAKLNHNRLSRMNIRRINLPIRQLLELIRTNKAEFGVRYRSYSGEEV